MNDFLHPTIDEIADLHGQLLEPDEAAVIEGHLAGCADCACVLVALDDVSALLLDVGAEQVALPASVAADLDAALDRAGAERAAGVSALADRRTSDAVSPSPAPSLSPAPSRGSSRTASRQRSSWVWLAAAAVTAVIAIPTGLGMLSGGSSDDSATDSAGAEQAPADTRSQQDGVAGAPGSGGGGAKPDNGSRAGDGANQERDPQDQDPTGACCPETDIDLSGEERLNPRNLAGFAVAAKIDVLEAKPTPRLRARQCATFERFDKAADKAEFAAPARWRGSQAVVFVDTQASSVAVYDCMTPGELLYRTGY